SSTQAGGPPRQQKQRSSATLPREKTPRTPCGNPLLLLPVGRSAPRIAAVAVAEPLPSLWSATVCCSPLLLAPLLRLPDRLCCRCGLLSVVCRAALRCPLPGRATPSRAQGRVSGRGVPARVRAPAQRAANCGTGTPTPLQMEREGEAAANAAAARAAVWRDRPARRGGVARRCRSCWHTESGNGGNGAPQPAPVGLLGGRPPGAGCRRCRGRVRTVSPCAGEVGGTTTARKEAASARPAARQPNGQGTCRNADCLDRRLSSKPCRRGSR